MTAVIDRELKHIEKEVAEISTAQLITCVRAFVQIKLRKTERMDLTMCFQFPEEYPRSTVHIELKSKTLPAKLLDKLTNIVEEFSKTRSGQYQVVESVQFMKKFLDDNPLCVCHDEVSAIKKMLGDNDDIRLKQKQSQIVITLRQLDYSVQLRFHIGENYPQTLTQVDIVEQNFPKLLLRNYESQLREIARQCVEPPVRRRPKDKQFEPKPALVPLCKYIKEEIVYKYPHEKCALCGEYALPRDPQAAENEDEHPMHVERTYCKHLYHYQCLDNYMKIPPFTGGKQCIVCGSRIYHNKWHISPELAEARWAHKEAKNRELDEVRDFFE